MIDWQPIVLSLSNQYKVLIYTCQLLATINFNKPIIKHMSNTLFTIFSAELKQQIGI